MNRISIFAAGLRDRVKSHYLDAREHAHHHHPPPPPAAAASPPMMMPIYPKPLTLRRNMTEAARLPALMVPQQPDPSSTSTSGSSSPSSQSSSVKNKLRHWLINEGSSRLFFTFWVLLHTLVFSFGFIHYQLKDNLVNARQSFGWTFAMARAAALVLHMDVAVLLLPVCRNAITWIRRSYLNQLIPFDKK